MSIVTAVNVARLMPDITCTLYRLLCLGRQQLGARSEVVQAKMFLFHSCALLLTQVFDTERIACTARQAKHVQPSTDRLKMVQNAIKDFQSFSFCWH